MRGNTLRIEQVLEKIIARLQDEGIISKDADPKELLEKTMDHLTKTLGKDNLPNGQMLKDPMILMKLTLSVIATHKSPANAPIQQIFQLETSQQAQQHLEQLTKEMQLDRKILKFMQLCIEEKKEELSPDDPDKNKCVGLYDLCGTLLNRYETVFSTGSASGEKIQTTEELLSVSGMAENLKQSIESDISSLASAPTFTPYK